MRVLITGVGDAFTRCHYGSSAVIEGPGGYVMIDCPDLVHRALRDAARAAQWTIDSRSIGDILLTHLHGDHCNGLESMGFFRRRHRVDHPDAPRPRLHVSAPAAARLWERLAPAMDAPFDGGSGSVLADYFDVRVLPTEEAADAAPVAVAGLTVRARFTRHPVPTVGLLVSNGRVTLGWSGDTSYDPTHLAWLSQADVIVHEVNCGFAHTGIEHLNALPVDVRARMRLIHMDDDFDPASTDLVPLAEGEVMDL